MSVDPVEYLDYDHFDIKRTGCMRCNVTVAERQEGRLVHMSHSRRFTVVLEDNTVASLILCADCVPLVKDSELPQLEKTMKWGWTTSWQWQMNDNYRESKLEAYRHMKEFFNIKDSEVRFPIRVWKHLFKGKGILRRA